MSRKMGAEALRKAIDSAGGIDELKRGFERHRKDFKYFGMHRQELLRDYKEEWVAIYDSVIVGHNKDFMKLIGGLSSEVRKDSVIQHLTTKKMRWILYRACTDRPRDVRLQVLRFSVRSQCLLQGNR